jgi:hypothetical protein
LDLREAGVEVGHESFRLIDLSLQGQGVSGSQSRTLGTSSQRGGRRVPW